MAWGLGEIGVSRLVKNCVNLPTKPSKMGKGRGADMTNKKDTDEAETIQGFEFFYLNSDDVRVGVCWKRRCWRAGNGAPIPCQKMCWR
jgi:hypothetical protein